MCVISGDRTCLPGVNLYCRTNADIKGVTVFSTVTANLAERKFC